MIRRVWVFPGAYLPRMVSARVRESEPKPDWRAVVVIGWTGLRGVVSLAAALALPMETERGLPFPYRNLILFLSFAVIVGPLLLQGLSLRGLIARMGLPEDKASEEEELQARIEATERVMEVLLEMVEKGQCAGASFERVKGYYEDRLADLRARLEQERGIENVDSPGDFQSLAEQKIWWRLVKVERAALAETRRTGKIGDEAMHEIERDIDLLEARITPQG